MAKSVIREDSRLSVSAAARLLGVSVSSLRAWAAAGQVPHERTLGGHRRFDRDELRRWIAARGGDLPDSPAGRNGALVAGRIETRPGTARMLRRDATSIAEAAVALASTGTSPSERRIRARRDRMAEAVADLADALESGDLCVCLREAEWQAYRHGAAGLPPTQPVGEMLALGRAIERGLRANGADDDLRAIRRIVDRLVWRSAAGFAEGRRSRGEARHAA